MATSTAFGVTHPYTARRLTAGTFTALVVFGLSGCARDERQPTAPNDVAYTLTAAGGQQPDLDSALAVHRRHTMRLIEIPGVVGTGVGLTADGRPAITVFVEEPGVVGLPSLLEEIPVQVKVTGTLVAQPVQASGTASGCDYVNCTTTSAWPTPVPIGVSSGADGLLQGLCANTGTVGARILRWETGSLNPRTYALSNNHVFALENTAALGTNVLQPGRFDTPDCSGTGSTVIGTLSDFKPITFGGTENVIDAAIALTDAGRLDNWTAPEGYGVPNSVTRSATLGMSVQKYGRTTGLTMGQVTEIDASFNIGYTSGVARFVHQIVVSNCPGDNCSRGGDSGSLWVTNDASRNPTGLHFAGPTNNAAFAIANPIDSVLDYFGLVQVDDSPAPTASGGFQAARCFGQLFPAIRAVSASGGSTITFSDRCGNTGSITLSGATASGAFTAGPCGSGNYIHAVGASGGSTIVFSDRCGNTGTITLSGASASGGLTAGCFFSLSTVSAKGTNWITFTDTCPNTGYVRLF